MAPTKSTRAPIITRSVNRKNGGSLHSLNAGVHKNFQCVICNKRHGSKAALSRHFHSHTTRPEELSPFTHPSCWDEKPLTGWPLSKEDILDLEDDFDALSSRKQRYIKSRIRYAEAGVKNKKQLKQKKEQRRLRLLHWWFRANEEALRARIEFGPEGIFPRRGEPQLQDQGQEYYVEGITAQDDSLLKLADAPPISQVKPLSAKTAPATQANQLASNPNQDFRSASAETEILEHDFDRSLTGSFIPDFELASTRPLTSLPLLWCISNSITTFVAAHGECLTCVIGLKRAVRTYLQTIGSSQAILDQLTSRFDSTIMLKYQNPKEYKDKLNQWAALRFNERQFRKDRPFVWDVLEVALEDYFKSYEDGELPVGQGAGGSGEAVKVVVKATRAFVEVLGDEKTAGYLKDFWNGRI